MRNRANRQHQQTIRYLEGVTFSVPAQESRVWNRIESRLGRQATPDGRGIPTEPPATEPSAAGPRALRPSPSASRRAGGNHRHTRYGLIGAFAVLVAAVLLIPPVRTLAQDAFIFLQNTLFPRTSGSAIAVSQLPLDGPLDIFDDFGVLQEATDFEVRTLVDPPADLSFHQGLFNHARSVAVQYYRSEDLRARVSQQPIEAAATSGLFWLNANLAVPETLQPRLVSIGEVEGELIQGAWCGSRDDGSRRWCADMPLFRLRWRTDSAAYEVELYPWIPYEERTRRVRFRRLRRITISIARALMADGA